MKKTFVVIKLLLVFILTQQLISCKKELTPTLEKTEISSKNKATERGAPPIILGPNRQEIASDIDLTGTIEVKIWGDYVDGKYPHAEVSVDPSYVMIGGGARVTNFSNTSSGVNALLTSAYPKNDGTFSTFVADSKEHLISYNHRLWVYVIGMRLFDNAAQPIPTSTLINQMNIAQATSSSAPHPATSSSAPLGYITLSGGARINWSQPGNLLVKSFINGNGWAASGKDHLQSSPATIDCYTLSIDPNITNFGVLETSSFIAYASTFNGVQGNLQLSTSSIPGYKWLVSGVGGESTYSGVGRMLFGIYPNSTSTVTINDKDHSQVDHGTLWGVITAIKKQ